MQGALRSSDDVMRDSPAPRRAGTARRRAAQDAAACAGSAAGRSATSRAAHARKQPHQPPARQLEIDQRGAPQCYAGAGDRGADHRAVAAVAHHSLLRQGAGPQQREPGVPAVFGHAVMPLLQQRVAAEQREVVGRGVAEQDGAGHRKHRLVGQRDVAHPVAVRRRVAAGAQDRDVDPVALPVGRVVQDAQADIHAGLAGGEAGDARRQPQRAERRVAGDGQRAPPPPARRADALAGAAELVQCLLHRLQQKLPGIGRLGPLGGAAAPQQRGSQVRLQRADLVADRALADMQLRGRMAEAAEPRRRRERAQRGQGRQVGLDARHGSNLAQPRLSNQ